MPNIIFPLSEPPEEENTYENINYKQVEDEPIYAATKTGCCALATRSDATRMLRKKFDGLSCSTSALDAIKSGFGIEDDDDEDGETDGERGWVKAMSIIGRLIDAQEISPILLEW